MVTQKAKNCCGIVLRTLCFIIGYLHLLSSVLDIAFHLLTVAIVTNGFQCDVDYDKLNAIPWSVVEPILLIVNLGTHGFYPFPGTLRYQYSMYVEHTAVAAEPKCYQGMLHIYLVDILNFLINLIWLRIVISYVRSLHMKNPDPMRMFFSLSMVKIIMQIIFFGYRPYLLNIIETEMYWSFKVLDIIIALCLLIIVHKYWRALRAERAAQNGEKPPSYIECLIHAGLQGLLPRYEGPESYGIKEEEFVNINKKKSPPEYSEKSTENAV